MTHEVHKLFQVLETVDAASIEPWMSSVTTEAVYSSASALATIDKVKYIIREEVYKTARPSDSGK